MTSPQPDTRTPERRARDEAIADEPPLPPPALPTSSLHPAWKAEIRRRAAEIDSGLVEPIPWDEVQRRMLAQLDAEAEGGDVPVVVQASMSPATGTIGCEPADESV